MGGGSVFNLIFFLVSVILYFENLRFSVCDKVKNVFFLYKKQQRIYCFDKIKIKNEKHLNNKNH